MKQTITLALLALTMFASAQTKSSIKLVNPLVADLEKVAKDYADNFSNIKGEKISETTNTVEYESKVSPRGALESSILQIKSLENTYSWQAIMLNTESFAEACSKYRELYQQLNGIRLSLQNRALCKVQGDYDKPDESRSFASSLLEVQGANQNNERFIIEVALNYMMPEWSVKIYVYEKMDDDAIGPTASSDY